MIGVKLDMFVDRSAVRRAIDRKTRKILGATGAYGRGAIRRSLRKPGKKKKHSKPGEPPRNQTGKLKGNILFGVDLPTETVRIGPLIFANQPKLIGVDSVPELLEFGGQRPGVYKGPGKDKGKPYVARHEPRPFVGPQFDTTERRFEELIESVPLR